MADTVSVYGHRVRQARTIRHSPIKPLAGLLGMSPSAWSNLERSARYDMPRLRLRALAQALKFPEEFFTKEPGQAIHRGSLLFRSKKSIKMAEVDALTAFAEMSYELLESLSEYATHPPLRIPPKIKCGTSPEEAARATRASLDLPEEDPIPHVIHAVERAGIPVLVADIELPDARHDAYSVWGGDFHEQPLIVARPVNSWERVRWSVAHELGHLVMHRGTTGEVDEEEANRFANEFLYPASALRQEWPEAPTLTSLMPLKQRWQISLAALIKHGQNNHLIEDYRVSGLFKQLSARRDPSTGVTWRIQEPGWADQQPERPRLIAAMTERGMDRSPSGELFSSLTGWAADLMETIVTGQRSAPVVEQIKAKQSKDSLPGNVIALRRA
ncbi:ImmA/IrrE family metallo-endopeptidase [Streptomyces sp.]|uniref:XRE family transcriptional regulator n=1 Tax=Streptomyces sp. TaxID=1931 RepID=UPI0028126A6C|nr:ImmA/IrrE family metallo-endopeptidase [Streptomyces sp.]